MDKVVKMIFKFLTIFSVKQLSENETKKNIEKVEDTSRGESLVHSVSESEQKEGIKEMKWHIPTEEDHFEIPFQSYLKKDLDLYRKFGHHTGVDYGGRKKTGLPLFACADGEIIYREVAGSSWGKFLGNHVAIYVSSVDKSFLYCHMESLPPEHGPVKAGEQIGVMGNTGQSANNAIHLHLEGFHGRFQIALRSFKSLADIKTKTFDADAFIRSRIAK